MQCGGLGLSADVTHTLCFFSETSPGSDGLLRGAGLRKQGVQDGARFPRGRLAADGTARLSFPICRVASGTHPCL